MIKRRLIRVGVPFNRTFYFVDKGVQRGLAYEYLHALRGGAEQEAEDAAISKVHVVPLPMPRDMLLPALADGKGRLVVAQLTVTPERQKLVDFTNPTRQNVNEVVVTGPGAPPSSPRWTTCPGRKSSSARRPATTRACWR